MTTRWEETSETHWSETEEGRWLMATDFTEFDAIYARQIPGLCSTLDPRAVQSTISWSFDNDAAFTRVLIPHTGTLHDLAVYFGDQAGNISVALYSVGTTRTRLYTTGSIACPAVEAWAVVGDPALAVTAGDTLDFALSLSDATASPIGVGADTPGQFYLPAGFWPVGGSTKVAGVLPSAHPLPSSAAEASFANYAIGTPLIIARIT